MTNQENYPPDGGVVSAGVVRESKNPRALDSCARGPAKNDRGAGLFESRLPRISEHEFLCSRSLSVRAADSRHGHHGGRRRVYRNYSPAWGHSPSAAHSLSACGQALALSWSQAAEFSEQQLADLAEQQLAALAVFSEQQPLAQQASPPQPDGQQSSVQPVLQHSLSPEQQGPPLEQHASPALGWAVPLVLVMV